ncbi:type II secretion system F family protein [Microbacterium sp.]|uniref:type II secretion system F family protein n=1 Tax=Microbacterium sp. TaxID=51671 RepID=UPI003A8BB184
MTVVWGAMLAAGILLICSPWLWPARERQEPRTMPGWLTQTLAAAGFAHTPGGRWVVISLGAGVVAGAVAFLVTSLPVVAAVAAVAGLVGPFVWLRGRARRLRRARRALWSDVCDLLIASIRSGQSLPDAVAALSTSAPQALRPAFIVFAGDLAASGHFDSAILRVKAQLADPVADRIVETLRMARQVGGTELTAVLRALSGAVRAEASLRAEVEARQSWIRGAAVLGVVAPWVILVLLALRPEGAQAYATPEGATVVLVGAVISVVAFRLMLRVGRLPEPRRWFG